MNKNFTLKFKIHDIFVIAIILLLAIGFLVGILLYNQSFNSKDHRYVNIYHQNQRLDKYTIDLNTLEETQIITLKKEDYPRLINDFVIELDKNKGVRVKEVECYDNTCFKQGWVNMTNLPIVCIPNDVRIVISATLQNSGDIIVYGGSKYEENSY